MHPHLWWLACTLSLLGCLYSFITLVSVLTVPTRRRDASRVHRDLAPVTVLKPLCGLEPDLYNCLRSFCDQRHPAMQIVFGAASTEDPALAVVRRLQQEYPGLDIAIATHAPPAAGNPKVANLLNMLKLARHDRLVIADSDIKVSPDYLERVVAPLQDPGVGVVTCAYLGHAGGGLWSLLGSGFVNGWFTPSVFVACLFGSRAFAFGATLALRRDVLDQIGGFEAVADHMADDYRLGELTRSRGLRTVLSAVLVQTQVHEVSFASLVSHQLRWLRTIRGVRPVSYALAGVSFAVPLALAGVFIAGFDPLTLNLFGLVLALRLLSALAMPRTTPSRNAAEILLGPLSDLLSFVVWSCGLLGRRVIWRSTAFQIDTDGLVHPAAPPHDHEAAVDTTSLSSTP